MSSPYMHGGSKEYVPNDRVVAITKEMTIHGYYSKDSHKLVRTLRYLLDGKEFESVIFLSEYLKTVGVDLTSTQLSRIFLQDYEAEKLAKVYPNLSVEVVEIDNREVVEVPTELKYNDSEVSIEVIKVDGKVFYYKINGQRFINITSAIKYLCHLGFYIKVAQLRMMAGHGRIINAIHVHHPNLTLKITNRR